MAATKLNKQAQFKDELTVDFLYRSYPESRELAEGMALAEIHSIQIAMPRFNTLATLSKTEFNRFMQAQLQHKHSRDGKIFTIMVAGVIDTFTCMVENSRFYGYYDNDNKSSLQLMMRMLQTVKYLVTYYKVIGTTQLKVLIDIIEKSAKRIENETEFYKTIEEILQTMKSALVNNENKENSFEKMFNNNVIKNTHDEIGKNCVLNNRELKPKLLDTVSVTLQVEKPEIKCIDLITKELPRLSGVGDVNKNKRNANAFDVMMNSSRILAKKRKLTM
ncbi:hypothetical protein ILUMI_03101 [Ignelater luminosus]|uniref:Uncharacterized protein n=1 Tax=Ignelater luminosus TaxID=2038154 RepID=A0A8K0DMH7_IGNLU|nr:hypothetical protein ILUMI_03101 [Ignelater luminosus]